MFLLGFRCSNAKWLHVPLMLVLHELMGRNQSAAAAALGFLLQQKQTHVESNKSEFALQSRMPDIVGLQWLNKVQFLNTFMPALFYLASHLTELPDLSKPLIFSVCSFDLLALFVFEYPGRRAFFVLFLSVSVACAWICRNTIVTFTLIQIWESFDWDELRHLEPKFTDVLFAVTHCTGVKGGKSGCSDGYKAIIRAVVGSAGWPTDSQTVGSGFGLPLCSTSSGAI